MNDDTYDYNLIQRLHPLFCTYICYNSGYFNVYLSSRLQKFHTRVCISRIYVFKRALTWSFNVLFRCVGSSIIEYMTCIQTSSLLLSWNLVIFVWSSVRNAAKNVPLAPCPSENLQWDFLICIRQMNPRYGHSAVLLCLQLYSSQTSVGNSSSYTLNIK